ncbi:GMP reductase, partial [Candidatus Bathyarchaeota archaeon]
MVRKIFTYDDVILPPRYSELDTRDDGDTSVSFLNCGFKLPVIPANMRDVISVDVAKKLADKDYCYIMHRFDGQDGVDELDGHGYGMSISLGVNETDKEYIRELVLTPQFITIDV